MYTADTNFLIDVARQVRQEQINRAEEYRRAHEAGAGRRPGRPGRPFALRQRRRARVIPVQRHAA